MSNMSEDKGILQTAADFITNTASSIQQYFASGTHPQEVETQKDIAIKRENEKEDETTQMNNKDDSDVTTVGVDVSVDDSKLHRHSQSVLTESGNKTHLENPSVFDYVKQEDSKDFGTPIPSRQNKEEKDGNEEQHSLLETAGNVIVNAEHTVENVASNVYHTTESALGTATEFVKEKAEVVTHMLESEKKEEN